jgi:hypothetical protein
MSLKKDKGLKPLVMAFASHDSFKIAIFGLLNKA